MWHADPLRPLHAVQYKCIAPSSKTVVKTKSAADWRFIDTAGAGRLKAASAPFADMEEANANLLEAIASAERIKLPDGADFHVRMQSAHVLCMTQSLLPATSAQSYASSTALHAIIHHP